MAGCYSSYDPTACTPSPGPQTLSQPPDIPEDGIVATFASKGPEWGLVSTDLHAGRYLVVASAPGAQASPLAYDLDLLAGHLVPPWVSGIDFTF